MYQGKATPRPEKVRKSGAKKPFRRALKIQGEIETAMQVYAGNAVDMKLAFEAIGPYESHGHGWKRAIKNRQIDGRWNRNRSKYSPHQGASECARRVFQQLPRVQRQTVRELEAQI